jgi:outer membrane protein OmpA-like peptidoglycan-associated protein
MTFFKLFTFSLLLFGATTITLAQNDVGGLLGEYYNGMNFEYHALSRIDQKIGFSRKLESPCPGVGKEFFSIRWSGTVIAPVSGLYKFLVVADDGVRLWVNHEKLIAAWVEQEAAHYSGSIMLEAGVSYDIRIDYFNSIIHSVIDIEWEVPETEPGILFEGLQSRVGKGVPISSNFLIPKREEKKRKTNLMVSSMYVEKPKSDSVEIPKPNKNATVVKNAKKRDNRGIQDQHNVPEPIVLKTVVFEQQSATVPHDAHEELNRLVIYLKRHPDKKIELRGHTDYAGDSVDNHNLSVERAKAVEAYLILKGVDKERITSKGFGGSQPLIRKRDLEDRLVNRRVEFVLID